MIPMESGAGKLHLGKVTSTLKKRADHTTDTQAGSPDIRI